MITCLFDGNALFARSWFAAQNISADSKETPRLVATTMLNLLHPTYSQISARITHTLFCWDTHLNEAKNRQPKPPEYHAMQAQVKNLISLLTQTRHVEKKGCEGDDLVASAVYAADPETEVYIISSDKDLMQLAGPHAHYYSLHEKCLLSVPFICEKFHVKRPIQIALALAIQGDPVDSIAGIRGWGPGKVRKLFNEITKDMHFDQALAVLESHMQPDQRAAFYAALERTLLNADIPVPAPAPLILPAEAEVAALNMPKVLERFRDLKFVYEAGVL